MSWALDEVDDVFGDVGGLVDRLPAMIQGLANWCLGTLGVNLRMTNS
jgi:hypothetical protein